MKTRYLGLVSFILALSAVSTFADDGKGNPPFQVRSISYDEFKDRCLNPDKYPGDVQRAPENIKIQCTDITHQYVADSSGSVPLPGGRQVLTALFSDKFDVDAQSKLYAMDSKDGSCLRYKEVQQTLTVEKPLSCNDILTLKGDINDYCEQNLDSLKSANPKLVEVKDTGAVIDTCGGIQGGKDPGK
jgi:hypothetical protein